MQPGNDHHLIIREEDDERTFPLPEGETRLGRARSNELQLREKSVSRKHCRLERDGDRVLIFDDRTSNATRIQRHGKTRTKKANGRILRDQDVLFVGRIEIVYRGCSGPQATTTSQQSDVSPVIGAVPIERPQAPAPAAQQPPEQQPPQQWPGQQPPLPYPQQPVQPYQGQQPPVQPYPGQQGQQPPAQPYPDQQGQQPPVQPYPGQQGQQPPAQPPEQFIPQGQPPAQGLGPQPVTFNPMPAPEPEKPKKKKIKLRKRKLAASKLKKSAVSTPATAKSGSNPGISLAIGAGIMIFLLLIISQAFRRMNNDDLLQAERMQSNAEKQMEKKMSEREAQMEAQMEERLGKYNSKIAELQQMLVALEKTKQVQPGNLPTSVNESEDPAPGESSGELASSSGERILPAGGGGIDETRALIAKMIKERDELQGDLKRYGGLNGGTDTSKIEASFARRTEVMNNNRILNVDDDEDSRKTVVAKIPQKVELSKKDYKALIERLKETVGNYGLPVASPADLDPDLTELLRATGKDGAKGLVEVYLYSSELNAKMEKTTAFLKRRIEALMANAYKINKDKYKAGGGGYGSRHNHYLEQLQRLLELSEKKIEIKRAQRKRLNAFQNALGDGFERLTSIESTQHLTSVYSKSRDTSMKRQMVGAFSKGNALDAVPALIKSLSSPDRQLKSLVKSALASITGINLGDNKKIWEAWWKENSDSTTN